MADVMSAEEAKVLADRQTATSPDRPVQTLEVKPVGNPPIPAPTPQGPDLASEVASLRSQVHEQENKMGELVRGVKAKDKAIADLRAREAGAAQPVDPELSNVDDMVARLAKERAEEVATAVTREALKSIEPLVEQGKLARRQMEETEARAKFGGRFTELQEQAEAQRAKHPTLSLVEAMQLVSPAGNPNTTPATPVEGSRAPAPEPPKDPNARFDELTAAAKAAKRSGRHSDAEAYQKQLIYERIAAGHIQDEDGKPFIPS